MSQNSRDSTVDGNFQKTDERSWAVEGFFSPAVQGIVLGLIGPIGIVLSLLLSSKSKRSDRTYYAFATSLTLILAVMLVIFVPDWA